MNKLNIGCGDHPLSGWLNTDLNPCHPVIGRLDATQPFPFQDGVFDYIFSEHMIEHVPYEGGMAMLRECFRTLKPGGKIRISTPDLNFLIRLLSVAPSQIERDYVDWACRVLMPQLPPGPVMVLNNFMRAFGHMFIYTPEVLSAALTDCGFIGIESKALCQSEDPELAQLENEARLPPGFLALETMTFEANKP